MTQKVWVWLSGKKLMQVKNLELSGNNLTDSMQDLLGDTQHTGLSSLETTWSGRHIFDRK